MSVIATDESDQLANYSNYGARNTDIAAPGSKILSTVLNGQVGLQHRNDTSWNPDAPGRILSFMNGPRTEVSASTRQRGKDRCRPIGTHGISRYCSI